MKTAESFNFYYQEKTLKSTRNQFLLTYFYIISNQMFYSFSSYLYTSMKLMNKYFHKIIIHQFLIMWFWYQIFLMKFHNFFAQIISLSLIFTKFQYSFLIQFFNIYLNIILNINSSYNIPFNVLYYISNWYVNKI